MQKGDFVQFRIANDKRKRLILQSQPNFKLTPNQLSLFQRATNITLIEEHSLLDNSVNTKEHREKGVLVRLHSPTNDSQYGAIKCIEQDDLVLFSFDEVISFVKFSPGDEKQSFVVNKVKLEVGDSLEFSVIKCQKDAVFKSGLKAMRVRQLAKNSVKFELVSSETYTGFVDKEATALSASDTESKMPSDNSLQGVIRYETPTGMAKITFNLPKLDKNNNSSAKNGNKTDSNRSSSISSSNSSSN